MSATKLKALVGILADQVQDIELANQDILISRLVIYAFGDQLDILGELVGLPRNSLVDADYKAAIILQVFINNSSGNTEEVVHIAKILSGGTSVRYVEVGPGSYRLYVTGGTIGASLLAAVQRVTLGGVRIIDITRGPAIPFRMGDRINQSLLRSP